MGPLHVGHELRAGAEAQDVELANKMRAFWLGLSNEEQARLDITLKRLVDEGPDVTGHDMAESSGEGKPYLFGQLISWLQG